MLAPANRPSPIPPPAHTPENHSPSGRSPAVSAAESFPRESTAHAAPYDAVCNPLFSFPEMIRDLLAGFIGEEWAAGLDLSTLERWPESHIADTLHQRYHDRVWRMRERWLCVLVLLEFQATVDRTCLPPSACVGGWSGC